MIGYAGLFASAFLAATLLPMGSEAVLVGLLLQGDHPLVLLLVVATVGNVAGSALNWVLGRFARKYEGRRWFPASPAQIAQAQAWYLRYGKFSLLLSWVPIIGDPITVVAGALRTPLVTFLVLVTLAKATRYGVLAWATFALM
ncbi:YqaA family protein [Sulfitobacter sp. HNIBRBA2951]|uniref:YqaA family protein n=1 Tax=Sulfitobacter aquimarinus TaxID=3158557 RepID=UPI0032DFD441